MRFGEKVDMAAAKKGAPPVVFAVQPQAYFVIDTPKALEQWESDARKFLGLANVPGRVGSASESCSGGCSDDCDAV
ncbi:MAG: hypothetical protein ABJB49_06395 [Nitrospirota bacterium]